MEGRRILIQTKIVIKSTWTALTRLSGLLTTKGAAKEAGGLGRDWERVDGYDLNAPCSCMKLPNKKSIVLLTPAKSFKGASFEKAWRASN